MPEAAGEARANNTGTSRKWMCANCGYVYEQDKGDPAGGIPAGTAWEDIPQDWQCPDCGAVKSDFEMAEV